DQPQHAQDFECSVDALPVKLDAFEGPLDLLLHLIRKSEVNVYDIPIALITQQYLDAIQLMQELNLDVAGEFLVMAATLIHIKSKMLLPRPETAAGVEGDEEDPRDALVRRLIEHEKFKAAAGLGSCPGSTTKNSRRGRVCGRSGSGCGRRAARLCSRSGSRPAAALNF